LQLFDATGDSATLYIRSIARIALTFARVGVHYYRYYPPSLKKSFYDSSTKGNSVRSRDVIMPARLFGPKTFVFAWENNVALLLSVVILQDELHALFLPSFISH